MMMERQVSRGLAWVGSLRDCGGNTAGVRGRGRCNLGRSPRIRYRGRTAAGGDRGRRWHARSSQHSSPPSATTSGGFPVENA